MSPKKITSLAVSFVCALTIVNPSTVDAGLITQTFNNLTHGEIVNNQFANGTNGFTVSGDNIRGGPDLIVAFDTFELNTEDPDLEDPFDLGNADTSGIFRDLQDPDPNNSSSSISRFFDALIIQENGQEDLSNPGFIDSDPDDEGSRPAGSVTFGFNSAIDTFGFDLLDVENGSAEPFSVCLLYTSPSPRDS